MLTKEVYQMITFGSCPVRTNPQTLPPAWVMSPGLLLTLLLRHWLIREISLLQCTEVLKGRPQGGTSPGALGLKSPVWDCNILMGPLLPGLWVPRAIRVMQSYRQWEIPGLWYQWWMSDTDICHLVPTSKKARSKEAGVFSPSFLLFSTRPQFPVLLVFQDFLVPSLQNPQCLLGYPLNS